jgi:hypothetical protein
MRAYRAWTVQSDPSGRLGLYGLTFSRHRWSPGVNQAGHFNYPPGPEVDHPAPHPECSCGIWTLPTVNQVLEYLASVEIWRAVASGRDLFLSFKPDRFAIGSIETWGQMITHETGTRSEYAQVVGLLSSPELAVVYDVPSYSTQDELIVASRNTPRQAGRQIGRQSGWTRG